MFHLNQQFYKLSDDGSYRPASRPPPTELSTPYAVGASFVAKRHEPPPPFGRHYPQVLDESTKKPDRETQLQWCLSHPPVPGTTVSQDIRDISIDKPIRVGDSCGAQVVLTSEGLIAKFFDPLYYNFENKDRYEKLNVTASADKDYVAETAAYLAPHTTSFQGGVMPKHFGSWTVDVPIMKGETKYREVRMILIEHVVGTTLQDMKPANLARLERENIMIRLIEADSDLRFFGLRHDDLAPRNVIVSIINQTATVFEIIDGRLPGRKYHNPLFGWVGQDCWSEWGWLPPQKEANEWMWGVWGDGGKEGKYVKAEKDPKSKFGRPKKDGKKTKKPVEKQRLAGAEGERE